MGTSCFVTRFDKLYFLAHGARSTSVALMWVLLFHLEGSLSMERRTIPCRRRVPLAHKFFSIDAGHARYPPSWTLFSPTELDRAPLCLSWWRCSIENTHCEDTAAQSRAVDERHLLISFYVCLSVNTKGKTKTKPPRSGIRCEAECLVHLSGFVAMPPPPPPPPPHHPVIESAFRIRKV